MNSTLNLTQFLLDFLADNDSASSTSFNLDSFSTTQLPLLVTTSKGKTHLRPHHGQVLLLTPNPEAIKTQIKWGFLLHTYGFACLFFVLAFYAFFSILNLRSLISSRPFMSTINGFLCLLGISRAGCLFIDPYSLREAIPKVMGAVLWDIGFPCLTSAFCLIQLAFLQLTQSRHLGRHKLCDLSHGATIYIVSQWSRVGKYMLNLGPEKLRRKSCLSLIITAHFSFIIGADIAVGFQEQLLVVKHVVQIIFLCWGIFLCCTFLYGGYRVMGLLRNMPGGLLQRDPPDRQHKGIMQLALLAPYNNLASSVAAALVPTLLTPKIRITDENDRTFSYVSDSNSQPTEGNHQEPHPVPETSKAKPSGPSQNPVRPGSPDPRRKMPAKLQARPIMPVPNIVVSPSSRRASLASRRGSDLNAIGFAHGEGGSLLGKESPSRRGSESSSRRGSECSIQRFGECGSRRGSESSRRGSECSRRGSECSRRGSESSRRGSDCSTKQSIRLSAHHSGDCDRRGSECGSLADIAEDEIRTLHQEESPALPLTPTSRKKSLSWQTDSLRGKHHTEQAEDEVTAETSLLPSQDDQANRANPESDLTLHSILNHIAYVNRNALPNVTGDVTSPPSRKSQVQRVLNTTYITALLGIVLCLADVGRLCGPYGMLAATWPPEVNATDMVSHLDSGQLQPIQEDMSKYQPRPWPWFCFQTLCRALEFAMGCAMANITKQPVNSRHQYLQQQYAYSLRLKQHRESLYI